jgi:hypothetical protein
MKAMRKRKRVKTDAKDAYELANLLRLGSLPEGYIAPPELRELRELVRHARCEARHQRDQQHRPSAAWHDPDFLRPDHRVGLG